MPTTLSPLRYPGGKTQLYDFVKHTIKLNELENPIYCEAFSGGAGLAISLLLKNDVDSIILNDYDPAIYSFWYAILNETDRFISMINNADISIDNWYAQKRIFEALHEQQQYSFELGFATFFLNRTNRSGIITGGPIGGYSQDSKYNLGCRYNKNTLINKISNIAQHRNRIELYNLDANVLIENILTDVPSEQLFVYFDPPYYKQGKNLYTNFFNDHDHQNLSNSIRRMDTFYWVATYDNEPRIREIYNDRPILEYSLRYSANRIRKEKELFFSSPRTIVESFDNVQFE
jgi:DNA adenine methylase